jgi:carbonic anhydrase/acetyltransferase-like protein (isoleucine patch superfamily)
MIRSFNGKTPKIAESAFISEAAYVIGEVEIGERSSVWPGAVIRGDLASIKIGGNTTIQDNSVLHNDVDIPLEIGDNVVIGHSVVLHGRKIGSNTLIGNNATVLAESKIGRFCIIAAGSVVSQHSEIPDNSMVAGVPAKIKGQISQEQRRQLKEWPQIYTELTRRYKEQGL